MRINKRTFDFILSIVAIILTSFTVFCTLAPPTEAPVPVVQPSSVEVRLGETIQLDGSQSYDPNDDPISYRWEIFSAPDGSSAVLSAQEWQAVFTPDIIGAYEIRLGLRDSDGNFSRGWAIVDITVIDPNTPTADPGGPYFVYFVDGVIIFDGTESSTFDGSGSLTYEWDFGDDSPPDTTSGPTPTHTYMSEGLYTVTLTVTDPAYPSLSDSAITTLDLYFGFLTSDPGGPYSGFVGEEIVFDGTGSPVPPGHSLNYEWDFGDGSPTDTSGPTPIHAYESPGEYPVTLTVSVPYSGFPSDSATATTTANISINQLPIADPGGPYSGLVEEEILFDGTGSSSPLGLPLTYEWDFDDGSPVDTSGPTPAHTYMTTGSFTVTLTVSDGSNPPVSATASSIISPIVVNQPPIADPGGPYRAIPGVQLVFDGSASYDPDGLPLTYEWDFDDGSPVDTSGPTPAHTYAADGSFTVTLTVNDGIDPSTPASTTVESMGQKLADTGQENCYDFSFTTCADLDPNLVYDPGDPNTWYYSYGQDAQYGDNVLHLTTTNTDDPVIHHITTGLVWEKDGNGSETKTWTEANAYCEGLTYDSANDWRLPSRRELLSIINYGKFDPSLDDVFTNTAAYGEYWTVTPITSDQTNDLVWSVTFYDGMSDSDNYANKLSKSSDEGCVRCVRGAAYLPDPHDFSTMPDGTITDWVTGLNWQAQASTEKMNWFEALYYCEKTLGGYWRLPNIKELESLVDLDQYDPAVETSLFTDMDTSTDPGEYWSSTSLVSMGGQGAWQVKFKNGDVLITYGKDAYMGCVRCVRKLPGE